MNRKFILWLPVLAVLSYLLYSCVQDEIYTPDLASKEYNSKSFWQEDEKYIKNVMKIYAEHELKIKKINGIPFWDYAMSMGKYDETFMVVPIVENNRVVNTLVCGRFNKKVYFRYENSARNTEFFNNIIFGNYTKYKSGVKKEQVNANTQKGVVCVTQSVSMWYPNSETNPDAGGQWETSYYTNCYNYQNYGNPDWGDGGGSSGGFDYGGGSGGNPNPNESQSTPCEKTKSVLSNSKAKPAIDNLKNQSTQGGENGYKFKADGTPSDKITGSAHSVNFGDKTGYVGGYHNHTPTGIPMFSPPDLDQLLQFALAQGNYGNPSNAFIGMVAPNGMHYIIWFNGTYQDALVTFSQEDLDKLTKEYRIRENKLSENLDYISYLGTNLNNKGVEKLFFETLRKMGLEGKVNLQRIDSNGEIQNINLNSSNQPAPTPCPQ